MKKNVFEFSWKKTILINKIINRCDKQIGCLVEFVTDDDVKEIVTVRTVVREPVDRGVERGAYSLNNSNRFSDGTIGWEIFGEQLSEDLA